jgi:DNA-binding beta-propeller fold protein YncE
MGRPRRRLVGSLLVSTLVCGGSASARAELMIVASDEKISWDDQGHELRMPDRASKDAVFVYDVGADPESPSLRARLPLESSVYGPPTNVALTPDETLAFVTNPVRLETRGGATVVLPHDELHVIDLEGDPRHVATLAVGRQPSGIDVSPDGHLLLVANRADATVSVLRISGNSVTFIDTIQVESPVTAVRFTPDGRRALIVFKQDNRVGILQVRSETVTYDPAEDLNVGISPANVDVTPSGDLALVANSGVTGGNDGHADSVSVIDLTLEPARVIDVVGVGDGPEGLAISPTGALAVVALIDGTQSARADPHTAWAAKERGTVAVLEISGRTVRKTGEVPVGAMPEGVVFSRDGRYVYVGNFLGRSVSILRVEDASLVDTGRTLELEAAPAAMRSAR